MRIIRNVFGEMLAGERKLPRFEAAVNASTFGRVKFSPNVTKTKRLLSAILQLRASSYEPGNRAGSVTGTNSVVCSYGKFQPGRPG